MRINSSIDDAVLAEEASVRFAGEMVVVVAR